jgi:hypothetical protein
MTDDERTIADVAEELYDRLESLGQDLDYRRGMDWDFLPDVPTDPTWDELITESRRCFCPDDCNCHYLWRPNYCGCKGHERL